jgi:uncharacterized protein
LAAGLVIAALTTPVDVSRAVFLLPVQVSLLGVPSPAVTPTKLLFNVVATPGGLLRYAVRREARAVWPPARRCGILGAGSGPVWGTCGVDRSSRGDHAAEPTRRRV